jgi:hypothetical protein
MIKKSIEIAQQYYTGDADSDIGGILHDFDMQVSDDMRGRVAFTQTDRKVWYDAYVMLCAKYNKKPYAFIAINTGTNNYPHEGDLFEDTHDGQ